MEDIKRFTEKLAGKEYLEATAIGRKFFEAREDLLSIKEKIGMQPHSIGLPLGERTRNGFKPSLHLLERISEESDKKVFVNDKAEWLFLCGRDILSKSITRDEASNRWCLVQNEKDENLGLGEKQVKGKKVVVKNIFDRGDFLRREK